MAMNYLQAFDHTADRYPDRTAVVAPDGTEFTYSDIDERASALAAALDERVPGSRCATLALNDNATLEMMLASQRRDRANVQLSFRATGGELVSMLETAKANGIVFDDDKTEVALDVLDRMDLDVALYTGDDDAVLDRDGVESYEGALTDAPAGGYANPWETGDERREGSVFYTSGTTSTPKAVLLSQDELWYGSTQAMMEMSLTPEDTALVITPWYHMVTSTAWMLPHLQAGSDLVLHTEFKPHDTLQAIEDHGVTGLLAVPTQLTQLVDAQIDGDYDLSTLSYIRTGGSVVTETLAERASQHLTSEVHNTYGMTEAGANMTHAYPEEQEGRYGTVGKATFMWDLRVVEAVDPEDTPDPEAEVDPGETGEILVRGPAQPQGYVDNPEAQETLFVDGEWIRTKDVAYVDEDEYLHIVDRVDNMLVSGGENVYPQEVEEVLDGHPDVNESAVVGLPDETWGDLIAAVVSTDVEDTDGLADALEQYCKDSDDLADFKRPRRYAFTHDPLPHTETGTLQREQLREEHF